MRIYLDSNIFQDLKKPENNELYKLILSDSPRNVYCFSEAHIFDLVRDKTDEKFQDMTFMETIVKDNQWRYDKKIIFEHHTPREFYDACDWNQTNELFGGNDLISTYMKLTMEIIPVDFRQYINEDQLPSDFPEEFRPLLIEPSNMYEFMQALLEMTEGLNADQSRFKRMIQYLHKNSLTDGIYARMNIEGFDGKSITDAKLFKSSYSKYFVKESEGILRYNLFMQMHTGLELLGIVKGKPKKQKMMNLINDSRHGFFAAFCDVFVSKDADMITKTKFMYALWEVNTKVFTLDEFLTYMATAQLENDSITNAFAELDNIHSLPIIRDEVTDSLTIQEKRLNHVHLGIFDIVGYVESAESLFHYFTKEVNTLSTGSLRKEIEYVVARLVEDFGPDEANKELLLADETVPDNKVLREWLVGELGFHLLIDGKAWLRFFPEQRKEPAY